MESDEGEAPLSGEEDSQQPTRIEDRGWTPDPAFPTVYPDEEAVGRTDDEDEEDDVLVFNDDSDSDLEEAIFSDFPAYRFYFRHERAREMRYKHYR